MKLTPEIVRNMLDHASPGPWKERGGEIWVEGEDSKCIANMDMIEPVKQWQENARLMAAVRDIAQAYIELANLHFLSSSEFQVGDFVIPKKGFDYVLSWRGTRSHSPSPFLVTDVRVSYDGACWLIHLEGMGWFTLSGKP